MKKKSILGYNSLAPCDKDAENDQAYDVFFRLLNERNVFLTGEIEQELADEVIAQLLYLRSVDPQAPIQLYINSPGGHLNCMFAIYDIIQYLEAPVSTIVFGEASSAAAVLLACGTRGKRMAFPNATIMVHQPWAGDMEGQATDIAIQAQQLQKEKVRITEILARHTGQPFEKVLTDCERDVYLGAIEAKEYGLVDSIMPVHQVIPELVAMEEDTPEIQVTLKVPRKRRPRARK